MLKAIRQLELHGKSALDMGTGTGIIAAELAKRFEQVTAADIDKESLDYVSRLGIPNLTVVQSDLFSSIAGRFDLIVFNPPYLPCPYKDDPELCCGDGQIIRQFLEQAKEHLAPGGRILLLLSSLTPVQPAGKTVVSEKLSWEELRVIEIE